MATPGPWHEVGAAGEPAFAANWSHYSTSAGYDRLCFRQWSNGYVEFKGSAKAAAGAGATVFTLPSALKPTNRGANSTATMWVSYGKASVAVNQPAVATVSPTTGDVGVYPYSGVTLQGPPYTVVGFDNCGFHTV